MEKEEKKSLLERFAYKVFYRIPDKDVDITDAYQTLSRHERAEIRMTKVYTMLLSALWGAMSVLLLYFPQYIFPDFFAPTISITIPLIYQDVDIQWISTVYGILLVLFEVYILAVINLYAVHRIATVCGFPAHTDPNYEKHVDALIAAGLEQQDKDLKSYGIDPYHGISKALVYGLIAINKLKAAISNVVFKALVRRLLGRYALRVVLDLAGIPVYAFWNAFASYLIIKEAKIRIMGPSLIQQLTEKQKTIYKQTHKLNEQIYQAIQFVAIAKMGYHHNLFLLASTIFTTFDIEEKFSPKTDDEFIDMIKNADAQNKEGIMQLVLFGLMIDGELSRREKKFIVKLNKTGLLKVKKETVVKWSKNVNKGKGLENFFNATLT